jgi:histidyl-tRNA synthetase
MIKSVSGTQDILAENSFKWRAIENRIHDLMRLYNYKEVRTPIFEYTELFTRSIGEQTDIVSKEMYTFEDSGDRSLTLRPENTASVARMTIENNILRANPQTKFYYIGPMFRRERPQKGRYRQFHQFGIEAIGPKSAELDVETIMIAIRFFESFALKNITLKINSIGSKDTRDRYKEALKDFVRPQLDLYCEDCNKRFATNPLRILDCKKDAEKNKNAPHIIDFLEDSAKIYFDRIKELLIYNEINFEIDHSLVRGLDYYTDIVYEISSSDLGSQSALCGGGRYDYLFEEIGGQHTAAVGFACGLERLLLILEEIKYNFLQNSIDLFIASFDDDSRKYVSKLADKFRLNNVSVETDFLKKKVGKQLEYANKIEAKYVLVIGETEIKTGKANLKRMSDGFLQEIDLISAILPIL